MKTLVMILTLVSIGFMTSLQAMQNDDCPKFKGTYQFPRRMTKIEQEGCSKIIKRQVGTDSFSTLIYDGQDYEIPYPDGKRSLLRTSKWIAGTPTPEGRPTKVSHVEEKLFIDGVYSEKVVTEMSLDGNLDIVLNNTY